jgi:hypothetical protein
MNAMEMENLATAIFAERCPGIRMMEEDLPLYLEAARAAWNVLAGSADLEGPASDKARASQWANPERSEDQIKLEIREAFINLLADCDLNTDYDEDWWQYTIKCRDPNGLKAFLQLLGIETPYMEGPEDAIDKAIETPPVEIKK